MEMTNVLEESNGRTNLEAGSNRANNKARAIWILLGKCGE